ncbi:ABC transporter permease subunit [bacterium]|nr:ABC transporter permease subunit [bacterium]
MVFNREFKNAGQTFILSEEIGIDEDSLLFGIVIRRFDEYIEPFTLIIKNIIYKINVEKNDISWPYHPVRGHWLGIDSNGRDVLARVIYGLRISMTFGFLLVTVSMIMGTFIGAVQGYFGGKLDITGQRLIEIWSALPFLYVMILLGSIYGRSFALLLFCYGIFNWIGISYYMRGEFLRLRKQPFVDSAKCIGISPLKIIIRHILPNALTPIITFFPFYLVGAIGALAALDFLGFGLPPPTPSWGELLHQAQQFRWAWWLILYPSMVLFIVMLLGIFIGEGVRDAFDPRPYSKME